jgi:CSLREA domain-containing protein
MGKLATGACAVRRGPTGLLALALTGVGLLLPATAPAATIQVTTSADEFTTGNRCSLREAIWSANNDSVVQAPGCRSGNGADLIRVPAGTYRLTRTATPSVLTAENGNAFGDLDITAPVAIVHPGIRRAVINSDVFTERVFHVLSHGVSLQGLTIVDGRALDSGGGILTQGSLTVIGTTILDNSAPEGGGLATTASGSARLTNVTISNNSASGDGGGVFVASGGRVTLRSATVANNTADSNDDGAGDGGGVFTRGLLRLRNTLVAGNFDEGSEAHDCARLGGGFDSLGHNLIGNANGCGYRRGTGDVLNQSARLLDLTDNGGPTETHAVRKTSPAIGNGVACPETDQRGALRTGRRCTIGAWELVRCQGVVVNRVGTNSSELLLGTSGPDGFIGFAGRDSIRAFSGNDGLCGDLGNDRLEGGDGNDHLAGGAGNDRMNGGPDRDVCRGGPGVDVAVRCEVRSKVAGKLGF